MLTAMMLTPKKRCAEGDEEEREGLLAADGAVAAGVPKKRKQGTRFSKSYQPESTPKVTAPSATATATATASATTAAAAAATAKPPKKATTWGSPITSGQHCCHNLCRHNGPGMLRVPKDRRTCILTATGYKAEDAKASTAKSDNARYICPEHLTNDVRDGVYANAAHVNAPRLDPIVMADKTLNPALAARRNAAGDSEHEKQMAATKGFTPPRTTNASKSAAADHEGDALKIAKLMAEVKRLNRVVANLRRESEVSASADPSTRWWSRRVACSKERVYTYEWLTSDDASDPLRCSEYTSLDIAGYKYWIEVCSHV